MVKGEKMEISLFTEESDIFDGKATIGDIIINSSGRFLIYHDKEEANYRIMDLNTMESRDERIKTKKELNKYIDETFMDNRIYKSESLLIASINSVEIKEREKEK